MNPWALIAVVSGVLLALGVLAVLGLAIWGYVLAALTGAGESGSGEEIADDSFHQVSGFRSPPSS